MRNDIIKQYESASELAWPPYIDKLKIYSKPCDSLMLFYKNLVSSKDNKHRLSELCERAAYSFASDLMAAVTRDKMITAKEYLLGLGIHNITGQRKTADILNRLGHCLTYKLTCEIDSFGREGSATFIKRFIATYTTSRYRQLHFNGFLGRHF